ncbi:hypothetical protein, unlikely [Trypanosoma brucei gambiense DAL972]|uniref:Uncharacterized protein n=1 Tax=Trypanosoma brucei gambiense (strain MHOM/CI/86/DAL972) TaxID=679716 RepID=C9ZXN1_TRYB9|nr:hypothetical protein, unlikely [Trypanosoma brucei gambiense DAL972]CBH14175.1 hypothetical protein, unlikely [Trypanosoma brucei gambiense DAL972]|eukprot:XP_011776446.1 hypothetical protein, unlikely [Trypanosoma brucei gambiense DAL972]
MNASTALPHERHWLHFLSFFSFSHSLHPTPIFQTQFFSSLFFPQLRRRMSVSHKSHTHAHAATNTLWGRLKGEVRLVSVIRPKCQYRPSFQLQKKWEPGGVGDGCGEMEEKKTKKRSFKWQNDQGNRTKGEGRK